MSHPALGCRQYPGPDSPRLKDASCLCARHRDAEAIPAPDHWLLLACVAGKHIPINTAAVLRGVRNASRGTGETRCVTQAGTFCLGALGAAGGERADNSENSTLATGCRGAQAKDPRTTVSKEMAIVGGGAMGKHHVSSDNWVEKGIKPLRGRYAYGWMLDISSLLDAVDAGSGFSGQES